jgi:hypothetical protein
MAYARPSPRLARRTNGRTSNISDATNFLAHTPDDCDDGVNPNSRTKFRTFLGTGAIFVPSQAAKGRIPLCRFLHIAPQPMLDAEFWRKLSRNDIDERN